MSAKHFLWYSFYQKFIIDFRISTSFECYNADSITDEPHHGYAVSRCPKVSIWQRVI